MKLILSILALSHLILAQNAVEKLVCKRPGPQGGIHTPDACCPAADPWGLPYDSSVKSCCCDMIHTDDKICCKPNNKCDGTQRLIPRDSADKCAPQKCTDPTENEGDGEIWECDGHEVGATCDLHCEAGYELVGDKTENIAECKSDLTWGDNKADDTCCVEKCVLPPKVVVDYIIVLDKSSSIKDHNWKIVVGFLKYIIDMAPMPSFRLSVATFNNKVEQVFQFDDCVTKTKDQLKQIVDDIIYNGKGTHAYLGLNDVIDNKLSDNPASGNRKDVKDIVLFVTDGKSSGTKETAASAKAIREKGIEIYVIGVGDVNSSQLQSIGSQPWSKYIEEVQFFEDLELIVEQFFKAEFCPEPTCKE